MTYRARCVGKKRRMQAKARPEWWQHVGFMTTPAGNGAHHELRDIFDAQAREFEARRAAFEALHRRVLEDHAEGFTWVTASDGEGGSALVPMRDGEHMIGFAKGEP